MVNKVMKKVKVWLKRWLYCVSTSFHFNAMSNGKRQLTKYKHDEQLDFHQYFQFQKLFRCKGLSDDQLYRAPGGDALHLPLLAHQHGLLRLCPHLDHLRHAPLPPRYLVNQGLRCPIRQLFWYQQASTGIRISHQDCLFHHQRYLKEMFFSVTWILSFCFCWKESLISRWSWKVMQRSWKTIPKSFPILSTIKAVCDLTNGMLHMSHQRTLPLSRSPESHNGSVMGAFQPSLRHKRLFLSNPDA